MFHNFGEIHRVPAKRKISRDENSTYDCDLCDSGDWLSETEVVIHKKTVHKRELTKLMTERPHTCLTCVSPFPTHQALIGHIKEAHLHTAKTARRVEREMYICGHCNQLFFNKDLLKIHVSFRHMKDNIHLNLKCPLCHKRKRINLIYPHLLMHSILSVSTCPICVRKQKNRKALAEHMETHTKYYHCNICGYISNKEKDFNMHLETYDRKKRRFRLKNYFEYFTQPHSISNWRLSILNSGLCGLILYNKIYICILCRQICSDVIEMQEHILRDHSTEPDSNVTKKFCTCGEEFQNTILLKHHIFKNKGDHKLAYTEFRQSDNEVSSDEETIAQIKIKHAKQKRETLKEQQEQIIEYQDEPTKEKEQAIEEQMLEEEHLDEHILEEDGNEVMECETSDSES